jgi:hypothetical protein
MAARIEEGMEWTDGWFNYIAYRKADGTMAVRDVEGFDYSEEEWLVSLSEDDKLRDADTGLMWSENIKVWESEVGELPR